MYKEKSYYIHLKRGIFFSALFKLQFEQRGDDGIVFILLKL